jgi:FixJ family two-component response regulator
MVKGKIVSIVDDDESVRESLPDLLRSYGLEVEPYASAQAFLDAGAADRSDCVVLDVMMPGMSGPDLQLELARRGNDIPIVFITSHTDELIEPRVMKLGAVAYLYKPFSETAIMEGVNAALAKS